MTVQMLKKSLDQYISEIEKTAHAFPWEDKMHYAMWLRQTYAFVCHSTRLLTLASARCKDDGFHYRFMDHAVEEKAHEKLLERDFKALGFSPQELPELIPTAGIYQIQYYWTEHVNPIALFGYILLLEGLAVRVGGPVYEKTKALYGDKACNFIRIHVEADQDHLPKAFKTIENCDKATLESIAQALHFTAQFYHNSVKEIVAGEWKQEMKRAG